MNRKDAVRRTVGALSKNLRQAMKEIDLGKFAYAYDFDAKTLVLTTWRRGKRFQARCGARTRTGEPCRALRVYGKDRCRYHGGLSTGPKTPEGRARIAESNRSRAKK